MQFVANRTNKNPLKHGSQEYLYVNCLSFLSAEKAQAV